MSGGDTVNLEELKMGLGLGEGLDDLHAIKRITTSASNAEHHSKTQNITSVVGKDDDVFRELRVEEEDVEEPHDEDKDFKSRVTDTGIFDIAARPDLTILREVSSNASQPRDHRGTPSGPRRSPRRPRPRLAPTDKDQVGLSDPVRPASPTKTISTTDITLSPRTTRSKSMPRQSSRPKTGEAYPAWPSSRKKVRSMQSDSVDAAIEQMLAIYASCTDPL